MQRYKWTRSGMDMSNGGKWVKHDQNHDRAYNLLLAYAQHERDNHNPMLGGDSYTVGMRDAALEAAKEAG